LAKRARGARKGQSYQLSNGSESLVGTSDVAKPDHEQVLLSVNNLSVDFVSVDGQVRILDNVSLRISKGEVVGVVGESGSGKTTLCLTILGLLDSPPAQIANGEVIFEGRDLLKLEADALEKLRGTGINMVFQEPLDSLNPVYRVESQIKESIARRDEMSGNEAVRRNRDESTKLMAELLKNLCIDQPDEVLKQYPHELSGGMRQRVSISMSIVESPKLLIADEPTTGLDAYVQNRILGILAEMRRSGMTLLYVTHDLTVASQVCDRLYIMYAGRLMEVGDTREVLEDSLHPYTNTLVASVPQGFEDSPPLPVQLGEPPDLRKLPAGCKFHPRCPYAKDVCRREEPVLKEAMPGRSVACWKFDSDGRFG
jgi:oligopeptide/dipeptide ABC transporter ATP-binding protein